jgi:lipopolysaccharide/colanic/teichoic acid biosynthesis glycosyltransferase
MAIACVGSVSEKNFPSAQKDLVGQVDIMLVGQRAIIESAGRNSWRPAPLSRLRWQVPLIILLAAVFPAWILTEPGFYNPSQFNSSSNTFIAVTVSSLVALLMFRRLAVTPGARSFGQIATSLLVPYLSAIAILFVSRLDYSRGFYSLSLLFCGAVLTLLWVYQRRNCRPVVHLVPGASFPMRHPNITVVPLAEASLPVGRNAILAADFRMELAPAWEKLLLDAALAGIPVYHVKQLQESILGKVEIEHLSENSFGALLPNLAYLRFKRIVDLIVTLLALPVAIPVIVLVALAIKIDGGGRIFFVQERMGYRGERFRMLKFRTMRAIPDEDGECDRSRAMTASRDPRITRIGHFLRRYRLDELPQIFNVLKGDMSWIGPRPEATPLSSWYRNEIPFYAYRHLVRPGITGWAQVHQGHVTDVTDVREKLYYDFYYIKYFSPWLDALIVLQTIRALLVGHGAK